MNDDQFSIGVRNSIQNTVAMYLNPAQAKTVQEIAWFDRNSLWFKSKRSAITMPGALDRAMIG